VWLLVMRCDRVLPPTAAGEGAERAASPARVDCGCEVGGSERTNGGRASATRASFAVGFSRSGVTRQSHILLVVNKIIIALSFASV
jgi:hypothetical protein